MGARKPPRTPAEESAVVAMQEEHDAELVAHTATRVRLEHEVETLRARLAELEAELSRAAARARELEMQLAARRR
jgi:chromosome segregation ATPase